MKWFLKLSNVQTLIILIVGFISSYVATHYPIKVQTNMMLFGLVISFPLIFSLQSAFKRREKCLEYLGLFKAALSSVKESVQLARKLSPENQQEAHNVIAKANEVFFNFLKHNNSTPAKVYSTVQQISEFMMAHREDIPKRVMIRIIRYMKDVYNSVSYLNSIKTHRTVTGVRILSNVFISLFPVLQAFFLVGSFGIGFPPVAIYALSAFTSFILGTLLLIQRQLEDPFDQDGLDDIKLEEFKV